MTLWNPLAASLRIGCVVRYLFMLFALAGVCRLSLARGCFVSLAKFILFILFPFLFKRKGRKENLVSSNLLFLFPWFISSLSYFYQLFFYLKRKVAKESRFKGNGVSIPFPLKYPLSLNDQRVSDPLESFSRRHNASAGLCRFAFSSNGCFVYAPLAKGAYKGSLYY